MSINENLVSDFSNASLSVISETVNPFSLSNNKWRLAATHKETSAEIQNRLINHCAFWKAYFLWAINDKIQYVDVRSTPTPVKIYGNGFALKPFEDAAWQNYFYDLADCKLANNNVAAYF